MQEKEKARRLQEQIDNIRKETDNPAIINDVDDNETLDNFEEIIVKNVVEGKTWNTDRE
jgi:hypothetical protein